MDIAESVASAVGNSIAPIAENTVATIIKGVRAIVTDDLLAKLSGKEIVFTVKIPDLTK